jgi:hypothetical protein
MLFFVGVLMDSIDVGRSGSEPRQNTEANQRLQSMKSCQRRERKQITGQGAVRSSVMLSQVDVKSDQVQHLHVCDEPWSQIQVASK